MKLTIYDVSHGFCARVVTPNGKALFFDCGFRDGATPHPMAEMKAEGIEEVSRLTISNYDQDHVRGLPELLDTFNVKGLVRNESLPVDVLRAMKEEGGIVTDAMEATLKMHTEYVHPLPQPIDFGGVEIRNFYNSYPDFEDTNNLSVVSFLKCGLWSVLFTGDMEKAGWEKLLLREKFKTMLAEVKVFVASHHGRENGYCPEIFDYCKPEIIVISDKEYVHESQENSYAQHAEGIPWNDGKRYVFTTRSDGTIFFRRGANGVFLISTENGG